HPCSSCAPLSLSLADLTPPPRSSLFPYTTLFRSIELTGDSYIGGLSTIQAAPGCTVSIGRHCSISHNVRIYTSSAAADSDFRTKSEEHTSELQSRENLVCRLLLEKKKTKKTPSPP